MLLMCIFALIAHWLACIWYITLVFSICNSDQKFTKNDTQNMGDITAKTRHPFHHRCTVVPYPYSMKVGTECNRLQMNGVNQYPHNAATTMRSW